MDEETQKRADEAVVFAEQSAAKADEVTLYLMIRGLRGQIERLEHHKESGEVPATPEIGFQVDVLQRQMGVAVRRVFDAILQLPGDMHLPIDAEREAFQGWYDRWEGWRRALDAGRWRDFMDTYRKSAVEANGDPSLYAAFLPDFARTAG